MSDAVTLLLILPGLLLAIVFADMPPATAATASYRAANYAVRAADHAADHIAADPQQWRTVDPDRPTRSKPTAGCPPGATVFSPTRRFDIGLHAQPDPPDSA